MLSGNAVGLMSQESFVDELNPQDQKQSKETVLYFANKQGNRLKKITTDITYNAVEPIARLLVEQLIAGVSYRTLMKQNFSLLFRLRQH